MDSIKRFTSKIKLGPIQLRKTAAKKLDTSKVKYSWKDKQKNIQIPKRLTSKLAEEIGIHLGDGFLSKKRNDFRVKGHQIDEREYYDKHIKKLYRNVYNLDLKIKDYENTYGFEECSKALWTFKTRVIGIQAGRKYSIQIPELIRKGDQEVVTSFLRGMFDTDGNLKFQSLYSHQGYYPVISLWQRSEKLTLGIGELLKLLGLKPTFYTSKEDKGLGVILSGYANFERFNSLIHFNNSKHVKKIERFNQENPGQLKKFGKVIHIPVKDRS